MFPRPIQVNSEIPIDDKMICFARDAWPGSCCPNPWAQATQKDITIKDRLALSGLRPRVPVSQFISTIIPVRSQLIFSNELTLSLYAGALAKLSDLKIFVALLTHGSPFIGSDLGFARVSLVKNYCTQEGEQISVRNPSQNPVPLHHGIAPEVE